MYEHNIIICMKTGNHKPFPLSEHQERMEYIPDSSEIKEGRAIQLNASLLWSWRVQINMGTRARSGYSRTELIVPFPL